MSAIIPANYEDESAIDRSLPAQVDYIGLGIFLGFVVLVITYIAINYFIQHRATRRLKPGLKGATRYYAYLGNFEALNALSIAPGFDIDSSVDGYTALHAAAVAGRADVIHWLCRRGANVAASKQDGWGDTALHYAAGNGNIDAVRALLAWGADPTAKNNFGVTAADVAANRHHKDISSYVDDVVNGKILAPTPQDLLGDVDSTPIAPEMYLEFSGLAALSPAEQEAKWKPVTQRGFEGYGTEGTRLRRSVKVFQVLATCALVFHTTYLLWRALRSFVPYVYGYSAVSFVVEFTFYPYAFLFVLALWCQIDRQQRWAGELLSASDLPHVDVYIVRYNEPVSVLEPAVIAALNMHWPGDKLTVHVLDDGAANGGGREIHQLMRRLRFQLAYMERDAKLVYSSRKKIPGVPHHAKAGNINHALLNSQGSGEYIVVLDTDMIVHPDFLQLTIGHFYKRKKDGSGWEPKQRVSFLQTPQDFWNVPKTDPMVHCARFFYGPMLQGRDGVGCIPCCGTGVVFSRAALVSIGGQRYGSITEDYYTSMSLFSAGFASMFLNERLAYGMAPTDMSGVVQQRERWAVGALTILFKSNPLREPGLTWIQSLLIFESSSYFFLAFCTIYLIIVPIVFAFSQIAPITAWFMYEFAIAFGLYFLFNRAALWWAFRDIRGGDIELWRGWQLWVWMSAWHTVAVWKAMKGNLKVFKWIFKAKEIDFRVTKKTVDAPNTTEDGFGFATRKIGREYLKTLNIACPYLIYYVAYASALMFVIVRASTGYLNSWLVYVNILSLVWSGVSCWCMWPVVVTLLPRRESDTGWRVEWGALFDAMTGGMSTALSRGMSNAFSGRLSTMLSGRLSTMFSGGLTTALSHAFSGRFSAMDPQQSGHAAESAENQLDEAGTIKSDRKLHVDTKNSSFSGTATTTAAAVDAENLSNQPMSLPPSPFETVGRVAMPNYTATALDNAAFTAAIILPERDGHDLIASHRPSLVHISSAGECRPMSQSFDPGMSRHNQTHLESFLSQDEGHRLSQVLQLIGVRNNSLQHHSMGESIEVKFNDKDSLDRPSNTTGGVESPTAANAAAVAAAAAAEVGSAPPISLTFGSELMKSPFDFSLPVYSNQHGWSEEEAAARKKAAAADNTHGTTLDVVEEGEVYDQNDTLSPADDWIISPALSRRYTNTQHDANQKSFSEHEQRARKAVSALIDYVAPLSPKPSRALSSTTTFSRDSAVMVIPIIPASVFVQSIGAQPRFNPPPIPNDYTFLAVSLAILVVLVVTSVAEFELRPSEGGAQVGSEGSEGGATPPPSSK